MAEKSYLLAIRIMGYVPFITQTEMEHAQAIIDDLRNAIIEEVQPPFVFQKSEGELLFIQASGFAFQPQIFLEMLEQLYVSFALAQETMQQNVTCTCQACQMLPMLGLKMVLHSGVFSSVAMHGQEDITGADAMWVRHLQMSDELDGGGLKAFACFTEPVITQANLTEMTASLPTDHWQSDDLGELNGVVYDLSPAWQAWREQHHTLVPPEEAMLQQKVILPVPTTTAWEYVTSPQYRQHWLSADSVVVHDTNNGRVGVGSVHMCHHGSMRIHQTIVDWRPFEYFTVDMLMILNGLQRQTVYLHPLADGQQTEVEWLAAAVTGREGQTGLWWHLYNQLLRPILRRRMQNGSLRIQQIIADESAV